MFSIKDNKVFIDGSVKLNKRQKMRIEKLETDHEKTEYVLSIMGKRTRDVRHDKPRTGIDPLENNKNKILNKFKDLLCNESGMNHKPLARLKGSQWVGVEIECHIDGMGSDCDYCHGSGTESCYNCEGDGGLTLCDNNSNEYEVTCAGCYGEGTHDCRECDGYDSGEKDRLRRAISRAGITHCSVRDDGSLDDETGVEICLLFDASKGFKKLEKLCEILNDFDAKVDSECGLHVHLDVFGSNSTEVIGMGKHFVKFLPMLVKFMPRSRRNNDFCKLGASEIRGHQRYYAVNLTSFQKHDTIEIRLHSGSTNFEKIKNWIELLILIKKRYTRGSTIKKIKSYQDFIDVLNLPEYLAEFYDRRLQKFNDDYALDLDEVCDDVEEESGEEYAA